jgi:hypothetical protein
MKSSVVTKEIVLTHGYNNNNNNNNNIPLQACCYLYFIVTLW